MRKHRPTPAKSAATVVLLVLAALILSLGLTGCGGGDTESDSADRPTITVNSTLDLAAPPHGVVTLRSALAAVHSGGRIVFDRSLNGAVISLTTVGEEHSLLPAETYSGMTFVGFTDRDYGASALYAAKDLEIDASHLPDGITLRWDGASPARVLAVYGDLILRNLRITGGHAQAAALTDPNQPYTLARGGGLATWGDALIERCAIFGNAVDGDTAASRDRGAFGGGVFANLVTMRDSKVSGNTASGYGAAGGGVYLVGGAWFGEVMSLIERSAVTGNRTTAQHSYGGGVFSGGGGAGMAQWVLIVNSTLARNLVTDHPDIPETGGPPPPQYYYRGGGFYMTNGSAAFISSTVAENSVTGPTATFSGKPNTGGGGIAATIGSAHVVEFMVLRQSVVAGNLVNGAAADVFSGSLLHFYSQGYNVLGSLNFDYILVPIPPWWSVSRKHFPKTGDADGVSLADALSVGSVVTDPAITSRGVDDGGPAVLHYPPGTAARDLIPTGPYDLKYVHAQYETRSGKTDDFLSQVLARLRDDYGFGPAFGAALVSDGVTWTGDDATWVTDPANTAWIKFWRDLDTEIGTSLGTVKLGEDFWLGCAGGELGDNLRFEISRPVGRYRLPEVDQLRQKRPVNGQGDAGAVEE